MWVDALILFFSAFTGGILFILFPGFRRKKFDFILVFSGSYLFSITILHILPEVYAQYNQPFKIGAWILAGFLLQMILGSISSGIEHGHSHQHGQIRLQGISAAPLFLLIGLGIHAFLEGTIVAHPVRSAIHNHSGGILLGIVLHKFPAAIALMTVFFHQKQKVLLALLYLIIFSLASPAGLIITSYVGNSSLLSVNEMALLYALVSGSFLHISTTIFFESSPHHHLDGWRLFWIFLAVSLALLLELVI
ncbi:MAG: ZIP family metal transporter [Cyclobacteriaceae bacterium]|nr:ZIP family metal transporter [Cyclobacteriaceae bacterium]